jgi:hypothetical protein
MVFPILKKSCNQTQFSYQVSTAKLETRYHEVLEKFKPGRHYSQLSGLIGKILWYAFRWDGLWRLGFRFAC